MSQPAPPHSTRDTRAFAQERARATYQALIEASREVFAHKGFDDAQTPDIARAAGVSVGSFYRYFSDKRQAFIEMIEAELEASYARVMKNLTPEAFATKSDVDRRKTIDHVIDVLFDNTAKNPELHRVFLMMSLRDPEVARIRTGFEQRSHRAIAELLTLIVPRDRIPDPLSAAEVMQIAAQEVSLATAGMHGGEARSPEQSAALRRALADMLYRYVFG